MSFDHHYSTCNSTFHHQVAEEKKLTLFGHHDSTCNSTFHHQDYHHLIIIIQPVIPLFTTRWPRKRTIVVWSAWLRRCRFSETRRGKISDNGYARHSKRALRANQILRLPTKGVTCKVTCTEVGYIALREMEVILWNHPGLFVKPFSGPMAPGQ